MIDEVRGTAASLELGTTYQIAGRYRLGSADRATLLASATVLSGYFTPTPERRPPNPAERFVELL